MTEPQTAIEAETFMYRFEGGPLGGDRASKTWPPPEVIEMDRGQYRRTSYSQLPAGLGPHVMRGAQYVWDSGAQPEAGTP